jgi:hypothetical protein
MGAMTSVAIGPTPTGISLSGFSRLKGAGTNSFLLPFSAKMSNSYSTGGDTIAMPSTEIGGMQLLYIGLSPNKYGANWYSWNGSQTAPKIQVWVAFNTEQTAAVDMSAVTVTGIMILGG